MKLLIFLSTVIEMGSRIEDELVCLINVEISLCWGQHIIEDGTVGRWLIMCK